MRDSNSFLTFESFGNIKIEGSNFINSNYPAIRVIFTNKYFTPNQTTIRNCLFQNNDNDDNYQGLAIFFRSLTKMNDQFSLNLITMNNTFLNYQSPCKIYTL